MDQRAVFCLVLKLFFELCTGTHVHVVPGSTVLLPCIQHSVLPGMPITWTFNGNEIKTSGTELSLSSVSPEDQGKYVCSMMDTDNNVEMRRTYIVIVQALISYTIVVVEGTDARLPCNFHSQDEVKANALWFNETDSDKRTLLLTEDGMASKNGKGVLLYPLDHDQTMLLKDVTNEDEGLYHCESSNGVKLSTVRLIIKPGPTPLPPVCQGSTTPWETCEDDHSYVDEHVLQESLTEFSMELYSHFRESNHDSNLLFSPISISGALLHLLLGARNKTRMAIERAVHLPHSFHCVHSQMKRLREKLSGSLQMASQIYYNTQFNLSESFLKQSLELYDSEPVKLKNNSEENTHMINSWVAKNTKNKITQLVKSVSDYTQMMLLNAVSFSGMWTVKFNEKTPKGYFTKLNGDMVSVPTLRNEAFQGAMVFAPELKAQVMRFALTGNSSLYILLPQSNKVTDMQQVESRLTEANVRQMITQVKEAPRQRIEVTLPQIKLNVEPDLNAVMRKLGLSSLFEGANLCGMYAEEPLLLDEAKHKAYLELTETGVEAGATTALGFSRSYLSFSALRPFVLLLWSDQANVPLFIGRVTDP